MKRGKYRTWILSFDNEIKRINKIFLFLLAPRKS